MSSESASEPGGTILVKISAGVGLAVTASMLGFMGSSAVTDDADGPIALTARAGQIVQSDSGYSVEIIVRNASARTAADVQVEGVLKQGAAVLERSEATLGYVPGESERKGGLIFAQDPRRHVLEVRPTGYQDP